jgi:hypothetical protein
MTAPLVWVHQTGQGHSEDRFGDLFGVGSFLATFKTGFHVYSHYYTGEKEVLK